MTLSVSMYAYLVPLLTTMSSLSHIIFTVVISLSQNALQFSFSNIIIIVVAMLFPDLLRCLRISYFSCTVVDSAWQ
jgi:hypothetical protein